MPFKKRNQLWVKSHKSRGNNKEGLNKFFEIVAQGGVETYGEKLSELASGAELSKSELEFMDRFERLFEYVRPKLARTEHTGEGGGPMQITSVSYGELDSGPVQVQSEVISG